MLANLATSSITNIVALVLENDTGRHIAGLRAIYCLIWNLTSGTFWSVETKDFGAWEIARKWMTTQIGDCQKIKWWRWNLILGHVSSHTAKNTNNQRLKIKVSVGQFWFGVKVLQWFGQCIIYSAFSVKYQHVANTINISQVYCTRTCLDTLCGINKINCIQFNHAISKLKWLPQGFHQLVSVWNPYARHISTDNGEHKVNDMTKRWQENGSYKIQLGWPFHWSLWSLSDNKCIPEIMESEYNLNLVQFDYLRFAQNFIFPCIQYRNSSK